MQGYQSFKCYVIDTYPNCKIIAPCGLKNRMGPQKMTVKYIFDCVQGYDGDKWMCDNSEG